MPAAAAVDTLWRNRQQVPQLGQVRLYHCNGLDLYLAQIWLRNQRVRLLVRACCSVDRFATCGDSHILLLISFCVVTESTFQQKRDKHYDVKAALAEAKRLEAEAGGWDKM
jgi:hypothetical protein